MASNPQISIQLDGVETSIEFPYEGITTRAAVAVVGAGLYRLESVPLFAESASFMDVIEADATVDEDLLSSVLRSGRGGACSTLY